MPSIEMVLFLVGALFVGVLSMGGITWVYFFDKLRVEREPASEPRGSRP